MIEKNQIKEFLKSSPGYLKKGAATLAERLFGSSFSNEELNACVEALYEIRSEIRIQEHVEEVKEELEIPEGLVLKSAWQTSGGEMRYSFAKPTSKDVDLSEFQSAKEELLNSIASLKVPEIKQKDQNQNKESVLLEISLPDLHFGKGDTDELLYNFANSVSQLLAQTEAVYNIDRILFPIGNDGMNSEGKRQATTKGTPQHDSLDWKSCFVIYCNAVKQAAMLAATYAPVDIVVVQGNHDFERMLYAGEVLKAYFHDNDKVTVDNNFNPRKFYGYGEVAIMYTHGDKEKPSDLALIMATEQPELFAKTRHREIHCGHYHKEMILEEVRGIKTRFLPSICATDDWHNEMGYSHYRTAQALIWHPEQGLKAIFQHNV
jgi:predicted phosphodiesterase